MNLGMFMIFLTSDGKEVLTNCEKVEGERRTCERFVT